MLFDAEQLLKSGHVFCVQVSRPNPYHNVLLVEPTGKKANEFRRTGVVDIHGHGNGREMEDFFYGVEPIDILLC